MKCSIWENFSFSQFSDISKKCVKKLNGYSFLNCIIFSYFSHFVEMLAS